MNVASQRDPGMPGDEGAAIAGEKGGVWSMASTSIGAAASAGRPRSGLGRSAVERTRDSWQDAESRDPVHGGATLRKRWRHRGQTLVATTTITCRAAPRSA